MDVCMSLLMLQETKHALDNITVVTCHSIHALLSSLNELAHIASTTVSYLNALETAGVVQPSGYYAMCHKASCSCLDSLFCFTYCVSIRPYGTPLCE